MAKILSPFPLCPRFIVKIRKSRDPRLFVGTLIVVISRRDDQTLILRKEDCIRRVKPRRRETLDRYGKP